jgi:AraC-like DNA-binding protein
MEPRAKLLYVDAVRSLGVETRGAGEAIRAELAAVFAAFEQATALQICFRTLSDRWRANAQSIVPPPFAGHRSAFCEAVKARALATCTKCDFSDLPVACSPETGPLVEPFVRTCHAGADEVLLPLWSDGVLVAVLFVGQFIRMPNHRHGHASLQRLTPTQVQHVRTLTLPLRNYLQDVLRRLDEQRRERTSGRRGVIERYIRESVATGPSLRQLAVRLSLSPSRTSHVVRELTGRSFQQVVDEQRLTLAKDLLASSDGKISWIAMQAGFKDAAYFCRRFKRQTGMTPTAFRKEHRRVISV